MSEPSAVVEATPTPEVPVMDVSRGPLVDITPEQRAQFRMTGKLPEPTEPKVEESAPSDAVKEPKADAGDPPPPTPQERSERDKAKAAKRFTELLEENKRLKADLEARKPAESPRIEPKAVPVDKEPTPEDQHQDGTPKYKTYEEFTKAQARWEVRQEIAEQKRMEAEQAQLRELSTKLDAARDRYENFDETTQPFIDSLKAGIADNSIPKVIEALFNDSEVFADLVFTLAGDGKFLEMARKEPGKAVRYMALTESLINEELAKPKGEPPAPPRTQAPKPPAEVGGRAASPGDPLESAAKANDYRAFKAEANRRELARLKG